MRCVQINSSNRFYYSNEGEVTMYDRVVNTQSSRETVLLLPGVSMPNGAQRSFMKLLVVAYPAAWLAFITGLAAIGG